MCSHFTGFFLWLYDSEVTLPYRITTMANESQPGVSDELLHQLLSSVNALQLEVATLKSGATGGSSS